MNNLLDDARDLLTRLEYEQRSVCHDECETRALIGLCEGFVQKVIAEMEKPMPRIADAVGMLLEIRNRALDVIEVLDKDNELIGN